MAPEMEALAELCSLRAAYYRFLARAFLYPRRGALSDLRSLLPEPDSAEAWGARGADVGRALASVTRELLRATPESIESDHIAVFGHTVSDAWPPHETRFGSQHPFQETQDLADISAFYSAYGLRVREGTGERVDHVALQLEFAYFLAMKTLHAIETGQAERAEDAWQASRLFFADHVGRWAGVFGGILSKKAPRPLARALGELLVATLAADAARLDVAPDAVSPEPIPVPPEPQPDDEEEGPCEE